MDQRRLLRIARVAVWAAVVAAVAYGTWRFEATRLPAAGCSPLFSLEPGARLVFDTRPAALATGDVVLYRAAGELLLGVVATLPASAPAEYHARVAAGALWIVSERPDCPSRDSRVLGPIERSAVEGRLVLSWGP